MAKKNQQRLIESLQASLEAESRSKAEVLRTKKKLEADIQELEAALDHISRVRKKENKRFQRTIRFNCLLHLISWHLVTFRNNGQLSKISS